MIVAVPKALRDRFGDGAVKAVVRGPPVALVRAPSPRLGECELTYLDRVPIDIALAMRQHAGYVAALQALGASIVPLDTLTQQPDATFVEDAAIVLDEGVLITQSGAMSRRQEAASVEAALQCLRPIKRMTGMGTLDGGDVLRIGWMLYAGGSQRSNSTGIGQLRDWAKALGYQVETVPVNGCLHLKSACSFIPPNILLINPRWVDPAPFDGLEIIEVDPLEPFAANTLALGGKTLVSAAFPRTEAKLRAAGVATQMLDISEWHKVEAGLTGMSLILRGGWQ